MRFLALFLLAGLSTACNHMFYYPDQRAYTEPQTEFFKIDSLMVPATAETGPLHIWVMNDKPEKSKGLILHFHGNAQNLTAHASYTGWLAKEGYTVLIFDYRGYGQSPGSPDQKGLIEDSRAIFRYIESRRDWDQLKRIVLAQSLGGAVATTSLAEDPAFAQSVKLLIVEASFDSYPGVGSRILRQQWISWPFSPLAYLLLSNYRKPADAVQKLTMSKLFIHGSKDQTVPYASGVSLFEAAAAPKEFWEIPHGRHSQAFIPGSPYREALLKALSELP